MVIGICDDELRWLSQAEKMLTAFLEERGQEGCVHCFQTPEALLGYTGEPLDVLFLDIELNAGQDGIQLAAEVNRKWSRCLVVYLTNYLFYATEVYLTRHTFFVLKEQLPGKLPEIFGKLAHEMAQFHGKLTFRTRGGGELTLVAEEIQYFERRLRTTRMVTVWGEEQLLEKLDALQMRLPQLDFARCHGSYLVYLPAIRRMNKAELILDSGARIPVSRNHRNQMKQAFSRWAVTQLS